MMQEIRKSRTVLFSRWIAATLIAFAVACLPAVAWADADEAADTPSSPQVLANIDVAPVAVLEEGGSGLADGDSDDAGETAFESDDSDVSQDLEAENEPDGDGEDDADEAKDTDSDETGDDGESASDEGDVSDDDDASDEIFAS